MKLDRVNENKARLRNNRSSKQIDYSQADVEIISKRMVEIYKGFP